MKLFKIYKTLLEVEEPSINMNANFKRWFGDSKVVDSSGNPMICYHGTGKGTFSKFEPKKGSKGKASQQADVGSHFSIDKEYSKGYAKGKNSKVYECFLKIESPMLTNTMFYREGDPESFSKYVEFAKRLFKTKFKRIFMRGDAYYDKAGNKSAELQSIMLNVFNIDEVPPATLYSELLNSGFDGIFHEPYNLIGLNQLNKHPKAYIILKPNQIKAIDNDGSWDENDDDIYS